MKTRKDINKMNDDELLAELFEGMTAAEREAYIRRNTPKAQPYCKECESDICMPDQHEGQTPFVDVQSKHTPTPWIEGKRDDSKPKAMIDPTFHGNYINIDPGNGGNGVSAVAQVIGPDREANAAFIVRAVNSHDELLSLLKEIQEEFVAGRKLGIEPGSHYALKVRDAIAKAEGK